MLKVLIYLKESELAPIGGPLGYNYNLKKGLEMIDQTQVCIEYLPGKSIKQDLNKRIKNLKSKRIRTAISILKSIFTKGNTLYWGKHTAEVDLSEYDAVHFHSTYDMYRVRDSLKEYSGKVILTTHTPTQPVKEIIDNLSHFERIYMKSFYKKLDMVDDYAFERADYFIFPCEEAEEPYYNNWSEFAGIKERNKNRFYYNPTGIIDKTTQIPREQVRGRYGIPQDARVVCYVGRHNTIKGYADLKEIGARVLAEDEDVYFIIAGREAPLKGLQHDRWIEVGWTDDPASFIKAADLFVLPNRETYFDLVMLELLSLGQVVLATRTGGNKYFEKIGCSGVKLYNSMDECVTKIHKLLTMPEEQINGLRKMNRELFEDRFMVEPFAQRYLEILKKILES